MNDRRSNAILARRSSRRVPLGALCCLAAACLAAVAAPLEAAESWGGSFDATSDYLVRGISRSDNGAAIQADVHLATDGGFVGGLFASSVQFEPGDTRSAESSAFVGYAWQASPAWRAKLLASYYGYIGRDSGAQYNYGELTLETAYDDWLDIDLVYSPDSPRYVAGRGLSGVAADSAEVTLRTPWRRCFAATAGVGYSRYAGPGGGGYAYWSAGGVVDLAPWTLSLSYVNTGAEAAALFYSAAAHDRWIAAVIWRF